MWALYCLILLYYATKKELSAIRPLPKFIAIKTVGGGDLVNTNFATADSSLLK
jgi:hypothetical protein